MKRSSFARSCELIELRVAFEETHVKDFPRSFSSVFHEWKSSDDDAHSLIIEARRQSQIEPQFARVSYKTHIELSFGS